MPCYRPLIGYKSKTVNPNTGKRSIVFNVQEGYRDLPVHVPCGQCIGCRLEKSRQWAIRCVHEASLYENNCFLTLTYSDENLPQFNSLDPNATQLFMKRLRERFGSGIRSFGCGEYGEKFARPHYHLCVFNFDFPDKKHFKTVNGNKLYTSESLSELWPFGHCLIGALTFESAAYVARYVTKKITGKKAGLHYDVIDPDTGEILGSRLPEKPMSVSRRPGIGKPWLDKYMTEVYPSDSVVLRGVEMKPPRYYDKRFELDNPTDFAKLKLERVFDARKECCGYKYCTCVQENNTPDRLLVRETVKTLSIKQLKRTYENDD